MRFIQIEERGRERERETKKITFTCSSEMGKAGALEYSILFSEAIIEIDETFAYFFQNSATLININNTMFITFT